MKPGSWKKNRVDATGPQTTGVDNMMRTLNIKTGWSALALAAACLTLATGAALAVPSITWTGNNFPWDISADGSVVAGNTADGNYSAFRWTELSGAIDLGMHTGGLAAGGGTPDISDDGLHVSATVITADSLYATQGIWTKGIGWERSMPPIPPDGGVSGEALGSCWGLSGDGTTLTGFFWRPDHGMTDGSAHANTWNRMDGVFTHLPTVIRNYRGNDLNYDGSVVVGWSETDFGTWQPTVWENGGFEVLHSSDSWTQAQGVSNDGNTIWGNAYNPTTNQVEAAIWLRTPGGWQEQTIGVLPGTFPGYGSATLYDIADIGNIGVGYNEFNNGQGTGFVWTLNEGMVSAEDFFTSYGLTFPANYVISSLTALSHDGKKISGFGYDSTTGVWEGFVVTMDYVSPVPQLTDAKSLSFEPNFPNPFNPTTTIALSLDRAQNVRLEIFDARGRLVRVLHDGAMIAGRNEMQWDGRNGRGLQTASGVYFARANGEKGEVRSQRMMLVK